MAAKPLRSARKEHRKAEKRALKLAEKQEAAIRAEAEEANPKLVSLPPPKPRGLQWDTVARAAGPKQRPKIEPFKIPEPPPGVLPNNVAASTIAMDAGCLDYNSSYMGFADPNLFFSEGVAWMGFQALAMLSQRAEYRKISETIAKEMTRKFIVVSAIGDKDKTDRVNDMNKALKRHRIASLFRKLAWHDGTMGRGHLYTDLGDHPDLNELETPLTLSSSKIKKGSLKGFRAVEPMWVYPAAYTAIDPLHPHFYKPDQWYVNRRKVHRSRLLPMVGREVSDLLKPAYSFGGLSLTQMAKPYVDNWLRTRQSVSDVTHSFSTSGLKTSMANALQGGGSDAGADMFNRAELFNLTRDNRGLLIIDKDTEDFFNVSTPLGGLDKLQAQAQEQICSVATIPLVKFTGITPSGLNASSDGEIRVFYDDINAQQEHFFADAIDHVFKIIQLDMWGEIDEDIVWNFEQLWQLDDAAKSTIRKTDADTANSYITSGVLSPLEERQRLAESDGSVYASLDVEDLPDPPAEAPPGGGDPNGDPGGGGGGSDPATGHQEMDNAKAGPKMAGDSAKFMRRRLAKDEANFKEEDHPRASNGQFGSGGGGSSPALAKKKALVEGAKGAGKGYAQKVNAQIDEALASPNPVAALKSLKIKKQASGGHVPFQALIDEIAAEHASKKEAPVKVEPQPAKEEPKSEELLPQGFKKGPETEAHEQAVIKYLNAPFVKDPKKVLIKSKIAQIGTALKDGTIYAVDPMPEDGSNSSKAVNKYLDSIKMDAIKANTKPPSPSAATKEMHKNIVDNLDKVSSWNKPPITDMLLNVENAGTDAAKVALIQPIEPPVGLAQLKANEFLASLKKDYGVVDKPAPAPTPAVQAAAAKVIKSLPHKSIDYTSVYENADGQDVTARLTAKTKDIPGDFYAQCTAAYGGNHGKFPDEVGHTYNHSPIDAAFGKAATYQHGQMTKEEQSAADNYKGVGYVEMNNAVLGKPPQPPPTYINQANKHLEAAINKSFVPTDTPAYRGLKASLEQLTGFSNPDDAVGRAFVHKNFASISRSQHTSGGFSGGNTLLKFTVPAGTKGLLLGSQNGEREIVLNKNAMFRIDKVEKDAAGHKNLVHCTFLGYKEG